MTVRGVGAGVAERHLMRAPEPLDPQAVGLLRPGPTFGRTQHDHRPAGPGQVAVLAGDPLDLRDPVQAVLQRGGEATVRLLVRHVDLGAVGADGRVDVHLDRLPAVARHERVELLAGDARQHGRAGDLVAVEVQNR